MRSDRRGHQPRQLRRSAGEHERRTRRRELRDRIDGRRGGPDAGGGQSGSIGLGFAIPADQAKRIADELVSNGSVTHASLGVQLSQADGAPGAAVAKVVEGGPAAAAGLPAAS
jgi:hypothetical protein